MKKIFKISTIFSIVFFSFSFAQVNINDLHKTNGQNEIQDNPGGNAESTSPLFSHQMQINSLKAIPSSGPLIIDNPINDSLYMLGINDELSIYLWGNLNQVITVTVNAEGGLLIPSIAMIDVKGISLAQGKEKIKAALLKVYKKVDISISLSKLHVFRTYISGDVKKPGAYMITGQVRVSDLIEMAGGLFSEKSRLRGIEVVNDAYPTRYADIALFMHGTTIEKDWHLVQGDRVVVNPRKEIIELNGKVNYPGIYDFVPGDCLGDLLKAAGGFSRGADSSKITLTRFVDNKYKLKEFSLSLSDSLFQMNADDRILVCGLPEYRVHNQVTLEGEVKWPGVYPIQKDKTTLQDLIEMCGGFTMDADLNYSKIIRKNNKNTNEKTITWLKSASTNDLFSIERSYLKSQILEEGGKVSLNLFQVKDKTRNIILQDEDQIIIAKKSMAVRVSGAVKFPGIVEYENGKDYKYYIDKVGGFSDVAKKHSVKILKNDIAILLKPDEIKSIEPGDMIWVPERDTRQVWRNTVDVLAIVSSSIMVIVSIFAILK
jgi:protein involved in polysaccharide export with SLBB domain